MVKLSGIPFEEVLVAPDDSAARAELLLLSPSILVPRLDHGTCKIWDTLAIAEYLNEIAPKAGLLPSKLEHRAHCRSVCGEMHSGFSALRAALPMNIKGRVERFKVWSKAQSDIDRILFIWHDCLKKYKGPYLFGKQATVADAMFAPVVTRLVTYNIKLDPLSQKYSNQILAMPFLVAWTQAAVLEPDDIEELEVEF